MSIESKYGLVWTISNELHDYTGKIVNLIVDDYLHIPALSYIDELGLNTIRINLSIIPLSESVIAHIMSREYGHHILKHFETESYKLDSEELEKREDEADIFAAKFIKNNKYQQEPIEIFISETSVSADVARKRIALLNTFSK
jgi:hypothetical protein